MLRLTNARDGGLLLLNPRHVVAVYEEKRQMFVLTTTGVEYAVKEDFNQLGKMHAWANI